MKYWALGILPVLLVTNVFAQKVAGVPVKPAIVAETPDKAIPDTIFHNFFNLSPVLYTAPVGGYMSGTNGYGDEEKGQETLVEQTYYLTGVIYWFGVKEKNTGGDTSSIIYKLYKKDVAQQVNGSVRYVPGTVLAIDTVKLSTINAGNTFAAGLNYFALPQPLVNYQNYVSTFSMALMNPRDTIALYSTTDSLVDITDHSWEKWHGAWNTIKNAWSLNVDLGIFPVRDLTGASIEEQKAADFSVFPNPADEFIQVSLNKNAFDSYVILSVDGKVMKQGQVAADQFRVDTDFAAGYYVIGLYGQDGKKASFYRFLKK